ncbi:MAG: 3-deoxy-D-manno-octulosonic acid transferase [Planctomycetes bacterium]|nr:3-deoxy-D-manno-octulosonic acid transferase [Planctomycetota bacterium]
MSLLLDLAYGVGVALASPLLAYKALTSKKYRTGYRERFGGVAPREGEGPCAWLHAVSVGEMNLVRPLIEALAKERPNWEIVLSTTTYTGRDAAAKLYPDRRVVYFPLDFTFAVRRAMRRLRPDLIVLVELEVWPNFLAAAERRGVPVAIVNGRLGERSFGRYRLIRPLVARWLKRVARFCVQTSAYAERLKALGAPPERVVVTGNMKFESAPVAQDRLKAELQTLAASFGLGADEPLLIGGCTWPGEDEALLDMYPRLKAEFPALRLLLAPRQADRFGPVEQLVRRAGLPCVRRTALKEGVRGEPGAVILLDTIGELARVYALGTLVFVGGSLIPHGGQSTIEPSAQARPVLFGPHTGNFRDVNEQLLAAGAARRVADAAELEAALRELLANPEAAAQMGQQGRQVVDANRGATRRTLEALEPLFRTSQPKGTQKQ